VTARFGYQINGPEATTPLDAARRAEAAGFDTVLVSDHVGPGPSPMITLAAVAGVTERIRIGTLVLNVDLRNPVQVAWEAATLDRLSHGRLELGLGAGHTPQEYPATGVTFAGAAHRKARLMECVEVIRPLLEGEAVSYHGQHLTIENAQIDPAAQHRVPLLVGGNGRALLEHAGAHADIIGLQGLGRTGPDGHRHSARWRPSRLSEQVEQVRRGAGDRIDQIELSCLVQITEITDNAEAAFQRIIQQIEGLTIDDAREIPYLLVGTVDQIAEKIVRCGQRWGITYFTVRSLDDFAPVISSLT
jgi:probable F420-dependent oxidoreductase